MNSTRTNAVPALLALVLFSTAGLARNPTVLKLTDGNNAGPLGENDGPGAEQPTVVHSLSGSGKRLITTVWMSSQVSDVDAPYQCKCSTVEIDPLTGPRTIAGPVQLTNNSGTRPCNHPHMDINPLTNQILWSYGTDDGPGNNVQPYVQGLDALCNITTDRVRIGNNNGNDGAPWAKVVNPATGLFQVGYLENNERSRAVGITFAPDNTITKLYNRTIVDPANIGRPSVERVSDTQTLFCSSNGDNRPPEIGVRCALTNALDGTKIWSQVIAASQPNATPPIYMNQPVVALGENGRFYLQVERSNGPPNNNNNNASRGATTTLMYTMLPDNGGPHTQNMFEGIGANQVHATTCTGKFGAEGKLHAAVFDASITGSGLAQVQFAKFDVLDSALKTVGNPQVLGAYNGDSGYLANLYGQNPNTQGRDFMRCIGDIPNPGFGVANGFLPTVKSFFAFPYAGLVPGEEKNSLFLSLLPAEEPVAAPIVPNTLTVTVVNQTGGSGTVVSTPLGIDGCDSTASCTASFDADAVITLAARPAVGSEFVGWQGPCSGSGACVVRMDTASTVTATFALAGTIPVDRNVPVGLILKIEGTGAGTVASDPSGIDCSDETCASNFARNASVTLTATAQPGSVFVGWSGECSGSQACVVTMRGARTVAATFNIGDTLVVLPSDVDAPKQPSVSTPGGCSAVGNGGTAGVFMLALVGLFFRRRSLSRGAVLAVALAATAGCELKLGGKTPTIDDFSAVQLTVTPGTPVELTYQVSDAEVINVSMVGAADILPQSTELSGSIFTPPLVNSTTFVLIAENQGLLASKTVNVIVAAAGVSPDPGAPPSHAAVLVFSLSPGDVFAGTSATLSWQTSQASSGVILANDAILTVVSAAQIAAGTIEVTPSASTVYTISVTGSDGQQVTMTTAITVSATGSTPVSAREVFDSSVLGILQTSCGTCHETDNGSAFPDIFGTRTPSTYYERLLADPRYVTAVPEDSLLIVKGEHTGPAFTPSEGQKVTAWLVKEAQERGTGIGGGGPTPPADLRPRNLSEALTRFGACMDRQVWDATYGASNNTQVARQNTDQGQCLACHSTGTAGSFLSASSGDTFDLSRLRPNVLKLVLSQANEDGSFKDLVPGRRFELKGGEGALHPSYLLTQERIDAINSFVDQTLVTFRDYTKACAAP